METTKDKLLRVYEKLELKPKIVTSKLVALIKKNKFSIMIIIGIIVSIVIGIKMNKRYNYKNKYEPMLIKKSQKIKPYIIAGEKLHPSENGIRFAYSCWIYMDSVSSGEHWKKDNFTDRTIFKKGNTPILLYNPEENIFKVGIETKLDEKNSELFMIKDVNFQKWTHIVISVENRTVDVFINGELKDSFTTRNVPILNTDALVIGSLKNYVNGEICNLRYFNTNLDHYRAQLMYNYGKNKKIPTPSYFWWLLT